jgi:hypothetical protein
MSHVHDEQDGDEAFRWLALTCEVEREAPGLLDALGAADADTEEGRLDLLVREGDEDSFFDWLREARALLERAGPASEEGVRLAAVLAEVYLLLPGFRAPHAGELDELHRLQALAGVMAP